MEERLKAICFMIIIITIVCYISTILVVIAGTKTIHPYTIEVTWKNDIHNPSNTEFINEVLFNLKDTLVITDLDYTLQIEFCKRYYNTLDDKTKEWFNKNNK